MERGLEEERGVKQVLERWACAACLLAWVLLLWDCGEEEGGGGTISKGRVSCKCAGLLVGESKEQKGTSFELGPIFEVPPARQL